MVGDGYSSFELILLQDVVKWMNMLIPRGNEVSATVYMTKLAKTKLQKFLD